MRTTKAEMLKGIENVESSKLVNRNTVKCKLTTGENIIILHKTIIVSEKDGKFTLNSGGWRTPTTKDRINMYVPKSISIYQKNNLWYIGSYLFYDGIVVNWAGDILSEKVLPEKVEKKNIKMKARITKFCNLITKDNLPIPNNGDCWYCLMHTEDGISLGEKFKDNGHLLNHLKENYLVGSLLVNAMREYGYRDEQIGFHYQLKFVDTFKRATRRYLQKRLLTFNNE
jgi:hypothetical protein